MSTHDDSTKYTQVYPKYTQVYPKYTQVYPIYIPSIFMYIHDDSLKYTTYIQVYMMMVSRIPRIFKYTQMAIQMIAACLFVTTGINGSLHDMGNIANISNHRSMKAQISQIIKGDEMTNEMDICLPLHANEMS
eukprot:504446_1